MTDFEAKKAIIDIGKRMYLKGFVAANDGNITCRVGPKTFWTTPTGVSKGFMTPEMLVKIDITGKVLLGNRKPSSEVKMHLRVYQENPEIMAVTHAHPPVSTAYAAAGIALEEPILTESVVNLGVVPIARYAEPGTQEVPDSIAPYCKTHNAVLLANHGALTWGKDIYEAFYRLESVEYYATLLMYTGRIIGQQKPLSCGQIDNLLQTRNKLGITGGGVPPCSLTSNNTEDVITNRQTSLEKRVHPVEKSGLKGVTPIVRPSDKEPCGCSSRGSIPAIEPDKAAKTKEQIIAEVVRRVVSQLES
ncbi:MAG: class II aldolase/adducin family protein [Eubacteriales bacterium]|nr:class II aldolase/adducin family protein [Eubacteriales bacterium]